MIFSRKWEALESENTFLKNKVNQLENKVIQAQDHQDKADQYSCRNCTMTKQISIVVATVLGPLECSCFKIAAKFKLTEVNF